MYMEEKLIILGDIKPMYTISTDGNVKNIKTGKYLKYGVTTAGYYTVGLQHNDNSRHIYYIHKLVAEMFLEKHDYDEQINHKDKDRSNNNINNLEWCTQLENLEHQFSCTNETKKAEITKHWGKISPGSENGMSKINDEQCHFICKLLSQGYTRPEVIRMCDFPVSYTIVRFIHERKRWKHISKNYDW